MPDRGWPGPGAAAPAAPHEARDQLLAPAVLTDRPRTHPVPARLAHRSLLPIRPPPTGLIDPLAAAAHTGRARYERRPRLGEFRASSWISSPGRRGRHADVVVGRGRRVADYAARPA